jgi:hypothetical protein
MADLNEGRQQVKRRYADHGRIRINENGAVVRDTIIKFVGKNYVTEEDLHNHLIRLEEDRGGTKVNKAKWFARNQKFFTTFEKKGTTYYSLSKYGLRVLELLNSKNVKKAVNESEFKNIPSLSEWIAVSESKEVNEEYVELPGFDTYTSDLIAEFKDWYKETSRNWNDFKDDMAEDSVDEAAKNAQMEILAYLSNEMNKVIKNRKFLVSLDMK